MIQLISGVGDIIAIARFFLAIHENYKDADRDFETFQRASKDFGYALENLGKALMQYKEMVQNSQSPVSSVRSRTSPYQNLLLRPPSPPPEHDSISLKNIMETFKKLQADTKLFVDRYHHDNMNTIMRVFYQAAGTMASDLRELREQMMLQMQIVQITTQAVLTEIGCETQKRQVEYHNQQSAMITDLSKQLMAYNSLQRPGASRAASWHNTLARRASAVSGPTIVIQPPETTERDVQWLHEHFSSKPIKTSQMLDLSRRWYSKARNALPTIDKDRDVHQIYIDLSKAYWILHQVMTKDAFAEIRSIPASLQEITCLSQDITEALHALWVNAQAPSLKDLKELVKSQPQRFDLELPGADLSPPMLQMSHLDGDPLDHGVMKLQLDVPTKAGRNRQLSIYMPDSPKSDDIYLVELHRSLGNTTEPANKETYTITRSQSRLIPYYVWNSLKDEESDPQRLRVAIQPTERPHQKSYTFRNKNDMFAFNQALTGFKVKAGIPAVDKVTIKISWMSEVQYTRARLQLWFEDLSGDIPMGPTHAATFPTPMSPRPLSMDFDEVKDETTSDNLSKTSNTPSLHKSERLEKIESAQVVLYTVDQEGRQCIYFTSLDYCKLDPLSCCGRNKKGQPANMNCCDRLVLTSSLRKDLPLYKLSQKGEESLGIPLAENFLKYDRVGRDAPRPFGKKMPVKWCAIKFKDKTEKALFVRNYEEVCKVREKKMKMQQKKLIRAQTVNM
ncbi:hypothetical protein BZA77DRAFT_328924 [Pyronema omphalodes]|nr:hypothetical protein BZA77DRAFT_328924 [Pyronema omphalodes]